MQRIDVSTKSNNVKSIGFAAYASTPKIIYTDTLSPMYSKNELGILEIEFATGTVYQYHDVPMHVYASALTSDSIGAYVAKHIKGTYAYYEIKPKEGKR